VVTSSPCYIWKRKPYLLLNGNGYRYSNPACDSINKAPIDFDTNISSFPQTSVRQLNLSGLQITTTADLFKQS
jgi:hypothetical protein